MDSAIGSLVGFAAILYLIPLLISLAWFSSAGRVWEVILCWIPVINIPWAVVASVKRLMALRLWYRLNKARKEGAIDEESAQVLDGLAEIFSREELFYYCLRREESEKVRLAHRTLRKWL